MTSEHEMTGLVKLSRSRGKFAMRWSDINRLQATSNDQALGCAFEQVRVKHQIGVATVDDLHTPAIGAIS
jgi:hypothetical protein